MQRIEDFGLTESQAKTVYDIMLAKELRDKFVNRALSTGVIEPGTEDEYNWALLVQKYRMRANDDTPANVIIDSILEKEVAND